MPTFFFQDLLLGKHCCIDMMGATKFMTPRANWDKRCCSNERGPVVPPPRDLSPKDKEKINKQIPRMQNLQSVSVVQLTYFLDDCQVHSFFAGISVSNNAEVEVSHAFQLALSRKCQLQSSFERGSRNRLLCVLYDNSIAANAHKKLS